MSRDYKNVAGKKGKSAPGAGIGGSLLPFLTGLSIGLLVAFAVFLYQYRYLLSGDVPEVVVHNSADRPVEQAQPAATKPATWTSSFSSPPRSTHRSILSGLLR